jgi:hypothetical protein
MVKPAAASSDVERAWTEARLSECEAIAIARLLEWGILVLEIWVARSAGTDGHAIPRGFDPHAIPIHEAK